MIAASVAPFLIEPFMWGVAGNATQRAYNSIYCAVRNTPLRLDTLYGQQQTFYINGLTAMYEIQNGITRSLPYLWRFFPPTFIMAVIMFECLNALAIVWTWDWESIDDSAIIPETKVKAKASATGDGSNTIEG